MPWLQLRFTVDPERAEWLSAILEREGARAVTLEAASDQAIFDGVGGVAGFWEHTHVTALMDLSTEEIEPFLDSVALALAAAKLGARQVWAVDLDARALAVTCDNAAKNEVLDTIIPLLPEHADDPQPVDIVIANILAGPLLELAPHFAKLTVIGGRVVL